MSVFLNRLAVLTHHFTQWSLRISALGLLLMTLVIGWQVFARYVLNDSPSWSESLALLLMLYYIMLTAAVGVYEGFHLGLTVALNATPPAVRRYLKMLNQCLIMIFGAFMLVNGARLADFTADHIIPTLDISRAFAYWPFAAAGGLICLFALERLLLLLLNKEK